MACAAAAATGARRGREIAQGKGGRSRSSYTSVPARKVVQGQEALELRLRKEKEKKLVESMMAMYDEDESGFLDLSELALLLRDYADSIFGRSVEPSEADLEFLMFLCGDGKNNRVGQASVMKAVHTWHDMVGQGAKIAGLVAKHDSDGSCLIEDDELSKVLRELNDGIAVPDETRAWIMSIGDVTGDGGLDVQELTRAIAAWYGMVEEGSPANGSKSCMIL